MPNINDHKEHANQNHKEIPPHTHKDDCNEKISVGGKVEKPEPLFTVGGNVNGAVAAVKNCVDSLKK